MKILFLSRCKNENEQFFFIFLSAMSPDQQQLWPTGNNQNRWVISCYPQIKPTFLNWSFTYNSRLKTLILQKSFHKVSTFIKTIVAIRQFCMSLLSKSAGKGFTIPPTQPQYNYFHYKLTPFVWPGDGYFEIVQIGHFVQRLLVCIFTFVCPQ